MNCVVWEWVLSVMVIRHRYSKGGRGGLSVRPPGSYVHGVVQAGKEGVNLQNSGKCETVVKSFQGFQDSDGACLREITHRRQMRNRTRFTERPHIAPVHPP
jgi:hypothetical protein